MKKVMIELLWREQLIQDRGPLCDGYDVKYLVEEPDTLGC